LDETAPLPELINERLNFRSNPDQVRTSFANVESLLWFPLFRSDGFVNYIARVNGIYRNGQGEEVRFLFTKSGRRVPWIPPATLAVAREVDQPLIFTEGFFKALSVLHAGGLVIGFNGPWINEATPAEEKEKFNNRILVHELTDWRLRTRRIYFAFDLDQAANYRVRHAVIRGWILLTVLGAEVYQLSWEKQDKGIDDHLARRCGVNQGEQREVLSCLIAEARPFLDVLVKGPGGDASLVRQELHKVRMDEADRDAFAGAVARPLRVTKKTLLSRLYDGKAQPERRSIIFQDPQPWETLVVGNELLGEVVGLINKHILLSSDDAITVALWVFFTYLVNEPYVQVSPYLVLSSPDKRCGKTRLLELIERLVWRGYAVSDISKSGFFRLIEKFHPSLLVDEAHKVLKNRGDLLQMFLDAYSRRKPVVLINPETLEPEAFDIWCARALAFIGGLDDQLLDRSIEIKMARKREADVKPKHTETPYEYTDELRRKLSRWALDNAPAVANALIPDFKSGNDRAADNWEMHFRIAAVIDPDNVEAVIQIALAKEKQDSGDRASEQSILLKGVEDIYREACEATGRSYEQDIFLSLTTICTLLNLEYPKMGPWHTWKRGERYGANEYQLSKIIRAYSPGEPDRSSQEPDLKALLATWKLSMTDVRGFWLSRLRPVFERYQ
jgi:hypothetical protein